MTSVRPPYLWRVWKGGGSRSQPPRLSRPTHLPAPNCGGRQAQAPRGAHATAARDCNLELMHDIVMAYHRLTGQGEGEEPEVGKASKPNLVLRRGENARSDCRGPREKNGSWGTSSPLR